MSDNQSDIEEPLFSIDSFRDWIENTAQSTGTSREEILQRLIADYWRMNELTREEVSSRNADPRSSSDDEEPEVTDHDIGHLESAITPPFVNPEELLSEIGDLGNRIETLEKDSQNTDRLQQLEAKVKAHEEQLANLPDPDHSHAEIEQRTTQSVELYKSLEQYQKSLKEEHVDLNEKYDSLNTKVTEEFNNIRRIIEHLLEMTERNEGSIDELRRRQQQEHRQYKQLLELKDAALRLERKRAICETCETTHELQSLETATCRQCGRSFTDLKQESRWFGLSRSAILTTNETTPTEQQSEITDQATGSSEGTNSDEGNTLEGGFQWVKQELDL